MWILSLFLVIITPALASANCGKIERGKGDVDVLRVKKSEKDSGTRIAIKAKKNFTLLCNDIVVTGKGSRAKLQLKGRGGIVTMGPLARVEIETYKQKNKSSDSQTLKLLYGKVRALVKKQDQQQKESNNKKTEKSNKDLGYKLRITTPSAVAGVRGTDFFISHNPNTAITEQATIEGAVEVQRALPPVKAATSQPIKIEMVTVTKGSQVTVAHADLKTMEDKKYDSTAEKIQALPALKVTPIVPQVLDEIRQTSVLVQNDKDFVSKEAIEVLGKPETWTPPPEELPLDLKDLKEEF